MPWVTINGRHTLIGEDGQPVTPLGQGGKAAGNTEHTQASWEAAVKGNPAHAKAINSWSEHGYRTIRDEERWGSGAGGTLTQNFHAAIANAPNYSGEIYRGIDQSRDPAFMAALATPGSTVTMQATSSATKEWAVAHDFAESTTSGEKDVAGRVVMVIQAKTGVDISNLSGLPNEKEVLLRRGSSYKVVSSVKEHGRLIVHLHEV